MNQQVTTGPAVPDTGYSNNLVYFPPNQKMYLMARGTPTTVFEVTLDRSDWRASTVHEGDRYDRYPFLRADRMGL